MAVEIINQTSPSHEFPENGGGGEYKCPQIFEVSFFFFSSSKKVF